MTDLAAWLLEQITKDETLAKATILPGRPSAWRIDQEPWETNGVGIVDFDDESVAVAIGDRVAKHVVTWDPARVLAECEAKRRIIDLHPCAGLDVGEPFCVTCTPDAQLYAEVVGYCGTLRALALPYADRPGYREEWKP